MRVLPAVAVALALTSAAPLAFADQPAAPPVAAIDFRDASREFDQKMRNLVAELADPANQDRTHLISADYQDEADAFADLIEARQEAGLSVPGKYRRASKVRELPEELRLTTARRLHAARFTYREAPERSPEMMRAAGLVPTTRSPRY